MSEEAEVSSVLSSEAEPEEDAVADVEPLSVFFPLRLFRNAVDITVVSFSTRN